MNEDIKTLLKLNNVITNRNTLNPRFKSKLEKVPQLKQLLYEYTKFLSHDTNEKIRLHCILKDITEQPVCHECGTIVKMRLSGIYRYTFPDFCCSKCFSIQPDVKKKRANTNLKKYGATTYLGSDVGKKQVKETLLTKYGVDNAALIPGGAEKRQVTICTRYDSIGQFYKQLNQKREKTNLKRYGNIHGDMLNNAKKRKNTTMERYGVENVFELDNIQTKARETMIRKYGKAHALQIPQFRDKFHDTMNAQFGNAHWYTSQIPAESLKLLQDKEWLLAQYTQNKMTTVQIANMLSVSHSTILKTMHDYNIVLNIKSQGEQQLIQFITSLVGEEHQIIIGDRTILSPKELDIYIPSLQIAFEYNGIFWHSELNGKDRHYHINKLQGCTKHNIRLINILDSEWINQPDIVKSRIRAILAIETTRIYARKTTIKEITSRQAMDFFTNTHIQGSVGGSVRLGLYYQNELVAAMSFGRPRFSSKYEYELIRFSVRQNTIIVGGASKLFKRFLRSYKPLSVVSYSDLRWNTGNLYKKLGFKYKTTSKPNYKYFKPSNSNKLYSRMQFQKHKLEKKLNTFDPKMSEWQNMANNGYDRIWDCGNNVYVWDTNAL